LDLNEAGKDDNFTVWDDLIAKCLVPLIIFLFNYVMIPWFVYRISLYEGYDTRSFRDKSKLLKYFFYLFLITLILPATGNTVIKQFFEDLSNYTFSEYCEHFSKNLI
jgi:hypothetical protein